MKRYRVLICGENVFLHNKGVSERYGFYINVTASGASENEVIKNAKSEVLLRLENKVEILRNSFNEIELVAEEIIPLNDSVDDYNEKQGFSWYLDNELDS